MTYLVRLTTYAASRAKDGLPIRDRDGFVAIGSTGSRPESHSAEQQIADLGWRAEKETSRLRQLVRIELPEGVDYCPFEFAGLGLHGPHTTNASARDGNGPIVFIYLGKPASARRVAMKRHSPLHWTPASFSRSRSRMAPAARLKQRCSPSVRSTPTISPMTSRPSSTHRPGANSTRTSVDPLKQ